MRFCASGGTDGGEEVVFFFWVEPRVHAGAPCLHVDWVRAPGGRWQTSSTKQKNSSAPCAEEFLRVSNSQWCVGEVPGSQEWEHVDAKRRYVYQHADGAQPAHDRVGVG